jgi:hypothetical protein
MAPARRRVRAGATAERRGRTGRAATAESVLAGQNPQTSRLRPRTPNILASEWYGFQVSETSTGKTLVVSGVVITVMLRPQPGTIAG